SPSAGVRPAIYTKDFTRALAVAEMTAPAYACEARTTGPLVRSRTRSNALASSLSDVKGIGAAITLNRLACKGRMTRLQLEPSAHPPWTTTIVLATFSAFIRRAPSLVGHRGAARCAPGGTLDNSSPSPSAIVRCARTASRSFG